MVNEHNSDPGSTTKNFPSQAGSPLDPTQAHISIPPPRAPGGTLATAVDRGRDSGHLSDAAEDPGVLHLEDLLESSLTTGVEPAPWADPSRVLLVALVVCALLTVAAVALVARGYPPAPSQTPGRTTAAFAPPVALGKDSEYVRTEVRPSGELLVEHWIRSRSPITELTLAVPPDAEGGAGMTARGLTLEGDGRRRFGPSTVSGVRPARYYFSGLSTVRVRYVLSEALVRSPSVPGRALARVTSLDLRFSPRQLARTWSFTGARVLSAACSAPTGAGLPRPCGDATGLSGWQVRLPVKRATDRVMIQLDLN